jgi:hypothetical protein
MNACTRTESIGAFDRYENDFACRSSNTRIAPSQSPISRRQSSRTQRDRGKLRRAVVGEDRGRKEGKEPSTRWRGRPRFCGGSCSPGCARKVSDRRRYTSLHVAATGRWAEEVRRWCGGGVAVVWRWCGGGCGGGVAEVVEGGGTIERPTPGHPRIHPRVRISRARIYSGRALRKHK